MATRGTKWLNRKTWRRLLELHASGRISRQQFDRLKETLARERARAPEAGPPRLRLVREDPRPRFEYLVPPSREVA